MASVRLHDDSRRVLLAKGAEIKAEELDQIPATYWGDIKVDNEKIEDELSRAVDAMREQIELIKNLFQEKIDRLKSGDELPPGVIKMVKVFVAIKRKLQVGDKMAGILPEEDMPCLADGTPVDIVLNPLGVPSRMNVGQILETHLGWAALELGRQLESEVRADGKAGVESVRRKLKEIYGTKEIADLIKTVQSESKNAIDAVQRGARSVDEGVKVSHQADDAPAAVVVHGRPLPGQPDQREEREIAAGRDMDRVARVMFRLAAKMLLGKKIIGLPRQPLHQGCDGGYPVGRALCLGDDRFAICDKARESVVHPQSSSGNCAACSGMITPGSLREVQTWMASPRSRVWSRDPPLTLMVSGSPAASCHSREPQSGQKAQCRVRPLSVARDQRSVLPWVRWKSSRRTKSEMPKAEADCLRHSRQWQMYRFTGVPMIS